MTTSPEKLATVFRVTAPGGVEYLTNSLKEVLDEVNLARVGSEIRIVKEKMTRREAEASCNFVGRFTEVGG